ncbi:lipopolysaccharide heptosyltransferase II [bacterium]|nr:lipopolysaccharide heptosyltransferase II [bacterium]
MPSTLTHILVIRFSSIGDIILVTPMLRALKTRFPDCVLHVAVRREFNELLRRNPYIDRLISVDTSTGNRSLRALNLELTSERYDAVFDLQNNFRSRILRNGLSRSIHVVDKRQWKRLLLVKLGVNRYPRYTPVPERYIETALRYEVKPDVEGPELHLDEDTRGKARLKLRAAGRKDGVRLVGIAPGAKHFTKRWPLPSFRRLTEKLLDLGYTVAVLGGTDEYETGEQLRILRPDRILNCAGKLTLLETAAAIEQCRTVFVNDSGLMHMATAVGTPVIALFGSTVREFGFFPYQSEAAVVEAAGLGCRPCTHIGRAACPKGHFACMRLITAEDVLQSWEMMQTSGVRKDAAPDLTSDDIGT